MVHESECNRIFDLNSKLLWSDVLRTQINGMGVILQNIKINEEMPTFICRMYWPIWVFHLKTTTRQRTLKIYRHVFCSRHTFILIGFFPFESFARF